jgi:hypothetical protein
VARYRPGRKCKEDGNLHRPHADKRESLLAKCRLSRIERSQVSFNAFWPKQKFNAG